MSSTSLSQVPYWQCPTLSILLHCPSLLRWRWIPDNSGNAFYKIYLDINAKIRIEEGTPFFDGQPFFDEHDIFPFFLLFLIMSLER